MTHLFILFHNFAIQIFSLLLGIVTGLFVGWLATEEILLYQKQLHFLSLFLFAATFTIPLLFVEKWFVLVVVGGTYALLSIIQKEKERFFLLSPIALFLTTETKNIFFLCSILVFAATGVMTLRILSSFVKEKKLIFTLKLIKTLFSSFLPFIVVTMISYALVLLSN